MTTEAARPRGWSEPGRTTLEIKTGGWRTRRPVYVEATAPCRAACPAGEPIAHWIERARGGDWAGAWRLVREDNPFPAVTGRVCGHPCEAACNRGPYDGAVAINALERFVGDWGLEHGTPERAPVTRAERIAVVGGGPAGLACAYHLARLGYRVTVFERERRLGGLLRSGIPAYRLPRAVLDREIELILGMDITVVAGQALGAGLAWSALAAFEAVFVATGAALPLDRSVPGDGATGVADGVEFLRAVNTGEPPRLGARVVVVGGGSTAMDVARSARRLGAGAVTVLALEAREAMPALAEEVVQALDEGVAIVNGVGVAEILARDGAVTGVVAETASLGRDADGTIRPLFAGGRRTLEADAVLLALGQRPDLAPLVPALRGADGLVAVDAGGATAVERVFAGGDVASRQRTVAHAIGAGTRAARAIHARLTGLTPPAGPGPAAWAEPRPGQLVAPSRINHAYFPHLPPARRPETPAAERAHSFAEVMAGLDARAAAAEGRRCFTCGHCVACDTCLVFCPDMALHRVDGGYRVATDHCKGCGLCAAECPRAALEMVSET